ncbi:cation:proton antiporter domain-containing protein [Salinactinospora qingdaonensis]|uniref:Cation:proton antiporter n=1 Tax=Salinactinospora qingdaonensis TaxID=702744 RepID=A0ABP7G0V4_9ACTN
MEDSIFPATVDENLALAIRILLALVIILTMSALCGRLALVVRQPRVLGEMISGILLGPTLLGLMWPGSQNILFPQEVKSVLYVLSTVGLTFYMFLVGVGVDHGNGDPRGKRATLLAVSGMLPSLLLGAIVGFVSYRELSGSDVTRVEFALFLGGALSLTAFPMLARILYERRLQNSSLGRLALVAASIDDAAAWCLLAVLLSLHSGAGVWQSLWTIASAGGFVVFMLFGVSRLLHPLGARVARRGALGYDGMYTVVIVVLASGLFTDYIGIYSVFGGFIAGLAMPRDRVFREALHSKMMDVVSVLLLPIFFAFSGLNTNLLGVVTPTLVLPFVAVLLAGFIGKFFGCALPMRGFGFSWRESYAVGGLMNARGLMILIFVNIGLSQGLITQGLFSVLVLVAVVTTAVAMPIYRYALPEWLESGISHRPESPVLDQVA